MLAMPSAQDSLPLCERVSVRSSTSLAVSSVSSRPTKATLIAVGQMMRSVLRSSGTANAVMPGNPGAIVPSPPTLGIVRCPRITIDVTTMMATSGAGTAVVMRGMTRTIAIVNANSG